MPAAVGLRPDWDAKRVRAAAREARDADQARRLLAIAAAYEGQDRSAAAKLGAMGPQRLRDWVHRFNAAGPDGLIDRKPAGAIRRLTQEQEAELATLIEAGPDFARDRVVRRRGFRPISARPRHLGQDPVQLAAFKKISPSVWARSPRSSPRRHP